MAEVTYLPLHDPDDGPQIVALDSLSYWSHQHHHQRHDFDLNASDLFSPPDHSHSGDPFSSGRSTIRIRHPLDEAESDPESVAAGGASDSDRLGRESQASFVMDLFQERVEQSRLVADDGDLEPGSLGESCFGVVEGNDDMDVDNLELDLGLGLGFVADSQDNSGFIVESCEDGDFFGERRVSNAASSTVGGGERNDIRVDGFGSDSEDAGESNILGIDLRSDDEYVHEDNDELTSLPFCWDSLRLDDHRESNEDFEWEEVDGAVDEREVLSIFADADDEGSVSPAVAPEEVPVESVGGLGNLEWEVLLSIENLERNLEVEDDGVHYVADHDDYIDPAYETLFGQFMESENAFRGRPPASRSVVENLPSVVMTREDVQNGNALCAVCKDEISVGEKAKQLPCDHRYHDDCIVPWLGIRNTCPVCRYELPTDDTEYERRRDQREGHPL